MRLTDRLSQPQRIVVVVALGIAFAVTGAYIASLGNMAPTGWYAYAPVSPQGYGPRTGLAGWLRLVVVLALVVLWAAVSILILRPSPAEPVQD
jgi:heme/copper-type cytochrome/quinol oxidase subunit 1